MAFWSWSCISETRSFIIHHVVAVLCLGRAQRNWSLNDPTGFGASTLRIRGTSDDDEQPTESVNAHDSARDGCIRHRVESGPGAVPRRVGWGLWWLQLRLPANRLLESASDAQCLARTWTGFQQRLRQQSQLLYQPSSRQRIRNPLCSRYCETFFRSAGSRTIPERESNEPQAAPAGDRDSNRSEAGGPHRELFRRVTEARMAE